MSDARLPEKTALATEMSHSKGTLFHITGTDLAQFWWNFSINSQIGDKVQRKGFPSKNYSPIKRQVDSIVQRLRQECLMTCPSYEVVV